MPSAVRRTACAKVNLALAVGPPVAQGSRAGWHPIASWIHAIDLRDDVRVEPLTHGPSTCTVAFAPDAPLPATIDWDPAADLARRAHRALEQHLGRDLPARITVIKRIPVGEGLGGGSSDAAAALLALRHAFALSLSDDDLRTIANTLGSDVPFFIDAHDPPRPALVEGFGEHIQRVPRSSAALALILPPFPCPTPAVYRALDRLDPPTKPLDPARVHSAIAFRPDPAALFNDLWEPACAVAPALADLARAVRDALRRPVHLTGSGSALFVLDPPPDTPDSIAGARVVPSRLV